MEEFEMKMIFAGLVNQRHIIPISKYAFISHIGFRAQERAFSASQDEKYVRNSRKNYCNQLVQCCV
jgi:hypothetical protein